MKIDRWLKKENFKTNVYTRKQYDTRFKLGFAITTIIELAGHENFKRWMEKIGFQSPKHLMKIEKYEKIAEAGLPDL